MTVRLPLAIAAFTLTVFGALVLAQIGGVDAVLGPALAAVISTAVVLARWPGAAPRLD